MGTRAAAFTVKIRNLHDFHARIQHGLQPIPSGLDVANTLKYFSQTLLSVLKDVPSIPLEVMQSPEKDHYRISLFPSLDYKSLYYIIVQFVEDVPLVQTGAHVLGQTILHALACLIPFLEHEYMDTLPYIVASSMALFPSTLHKEIIDMLCHRLIPFTFCNSEDADSHNYATMSTSSILMMVFQYTDISAFHGQLLECLMAIKRNVVKDVLFVIAHGTAKARGHAVELLFKYWPSLNLALQDKKGFNIRLNGSHCLGWKPVLCQQEGCIIEKQKNVEAVKMCFEHSVAINCAENPPPLFVCLECAEQIKSTHGSEYLVDILLPMLHVALVCENKSCKAIEKGAMVTCFSHECATYNGNRPIRYCSQCHALKHTPDKGRDHKVQLAVPSPWAMEPESQMYMIEAIISLLKEALPSNDKGSKDRDERHSRQLESEESRELSCLEERPLLSRYGVWLTVGLATPTPDTPMETLGRLLSMLFQWFHYTACLPDDQAGNALERLKTEYVQGWLMQVIKSHFEVFVSCLLPHPADYARVGGHWESWPSQVNDIKEGFKRLLCIVPYDIITPEVWEYMMPFWMESFRHEIPEDELSELKILLSKVLDPDLSPLGFATPQMYRFLSLRFENTSASVQEQAIYWLQILTLLEVPVPLELLYKMFSSGVKSLTELDPPVRAPLTRVRQASIKIPPSALLDTRSEGEMNLLCFILMLDILIKQMDLQEISSHKGFDSKEAQRTIAFIFEILRAPWEGEHTCTDAKRQCSFCELCAMCFQLVVTLVEFHAPAMEVTMADVPSENMPHTFPSPPKYKDQTHQLRPLKKGSLPLAEAPLLMDGGFPLMTAIVQECQTDTVISMPTEQVVLAIAKAITLTEDDVAGATCQIAQATLVDENDRAVPQKEPSAFWHTTQGKFKVNFDELPISLQFTHSLLKALEINNDADVLYHILNCLKLLFLHAEVMNKAAKEHRGFLIWCQENLLISNLWKLLQFEYSQISQLTVALILHCVTLPSGADMFWNMIERDFHSNNWRSRFSAVEKVTMVAHFADTATVKNSPLLQSSLANAFCYLVRSLDDVQAYVAQRALLHLETIKTSSLKLLLWCLEVQFDTVLVDRAMILQTILVLFNQLTNRRFLTWDFFLNRLDTLFLEAQIHLEKTGEITYTRDLKNSNLNSEVFQRKLNRAHEAIAKVNTSRSLAASFGTKWPYKRAMSAPGGMISKQEKWVDKEKIYSRQSSAPVLKRKSSKLASSIYGSSGGPSLQHLPNSFFPDGGHIKEQVQEESHLLHVIHRAMDLEDYDQDTRHLLVFLLMQFLARSDQSHPSEEKTMARNQHLLFRHLNILLGYSPTEKGFFIPPHKLRSCPVFNAFLVSMPKVLDCNFKMGNILLNICFPLLIYCPSNQKFVHDHQWSHQTLWHLNFHARHYWLLSVLVILYKYNYDTAPFSKQVIMLIHIVLNTLEAHHHHCRHVTEPFLSPVPSRSRDLSSTSVEMENIHEPPEVLVSSEPPIKTPKYRKFGKDEDKQPTWKLGEYSCSSEGEEAELEAIPESPKSENSEKDITEKLETCMPMQYEQVTVSLVMEPTLTTVEPASSETVIDNKLENNKPLTNAINDEEVSIVEKSNNESMEKTSLKSNSSEHQAIEQQAELEFEEEEKDEILTVTFDNNIQSSKVQISTKMPVKHVSTHTNTFPWKVEITTPVLYPLMVRPSLERLLPIGPLPKDSRRFDIRDIKHEIYDVDKAVQTIHQFNQIELPAPERLLPVGPLPTRSSSPSTPSQRQRLNFSEPVTLKASVSNYEEFYDKDKYILKTEISDIPKGKIGESQQLFEMQTKSSNDPEEAQLITTKLTYKGSLRNHDAKRLHQTDSASSSPEHPPLQRISKTKIPDMIINKNLIQKIDSPKHTSPSHSPLKHKFGSFHKKSKGTTECHLTFSSDSQKSIKKKASKASPEHLASKLLKQDVKSSPERPTLQRAASTGICKEETVSPNHSPLHRTASTGRAHAPPSSIHCIEKSDSIDSRVEDEPAPPLVERDELKGRIHYRQRKQKKLAAELQRGLELHSGLSRRTRKSDLSSSTSKRSSGRYVEDNVQERCSECGSVLQEYSDEDIGLSIIILATFVHREPTLAASLMPEMLRVVAQIASSTTYPWQYESNIYLPGGAISVARQFIRCTLHQLAPNGIFPQLFNSHFNDNEFFKIMALTLVDFVELHPLSPLLLVFEDLNEGKQLTQETLYPLLTNVAMYLECLPLESSAPPWALLYPLLDTFLHNLLLIPHCCSLVPVLSIMTAILKTPTINTCKSLLEPFSKILSHTLQFSLVSYEQLLSLCHVCNRAFARDRDKFVLTRTAVFELVQALKFKTIIPDENLLMLVQFVLQDAGGWLGPNVILESVSDPQLIHLMYTTGSAECMKQHLNDALEFVVDVHTVNKIKTNFQGTCSKLNEETLGGELKAGISQFVAIEMGKYNGRDHRALAKWLPWLYCAPPAQGPREFLDCVGHIRLLSWLLLGALMHSSLLPSCPPCQPVPLEANAHVADHIQLVLTGFAEMSKTSVLHMSSLFHTFILCQLWTMYCEHMVSMNPPGSDQHQLCSLTLLDFWTKVTPGILQLICHSRVMAEMVSLHFLSLMEALMECNSAVLARLLPMWSAVLSSYQGQLPSHLHLRLSACLNWQPSAASKCVASAFLKWLNRLQFKIAQIELQSSTATQFYAV